ncbi:serine/threonine protein kinase [Streptomyces sp. JJ66]|nr:serine/threonine-protein kinase [Streptomyces sp. JJ66]MBW1603998.1 serine/threonine protein kinase [Streptomyces sp. JJ66]
MQPLGVEDPAYVGGYRLLGRLGSGGMGRVYLGRSRGGRTVAVKVVHARFAADEEFRARFRREVDAARRVGGEWSAPVLDADPAADVPWVATGYVAGPDLARAVTRYGPLPARTVRALGAGLAEALATVHTRGLLHRDVKPSNVLLTLDGPRLIDFGIARATDATTPMTATGVAIGSPGYMSPEQVLGREVSTATDVFSLGAVLAFVATGQPPFPGDAPAVLLYKVVHEPPELEGLEGPLRELVSACLAKESAGRPDVAEVARDLAGPAGAVALISGGWLPSPVMEEVSRQAVALLDLETEDPKTAPPGGAFGPPPRFSDLPTSPRAPGTFGGPGHPTEAAAPTGQPEREAPRRTVRRRTLLAVTGGLTAAALAVTALLLFSPSDNPQDSPTTVPGHFLGTWSGQLVTDKGLGNGNLFLTVREGKPGDEVVEMTARLGEYECGSTGELTKITQSKLTLTDHPTGDSPTVLGIKLCADSTAPVTLTLREGDHTLRYASQDDAAGRPTADLTRTDG